DGMLHRRSPLPSASQGRFSGHSVRFRWSDVAHEFRVLASWLNEDCRGAMGFLYSLFGGSGQSGSDVLNQFKASRRVNPANTAVRVMRTTVSHLSRLVSTIIP